MAWTLSAATLTKALASGVVQGTIQPAAAVAAGVTQADVQAAAQRLAERAAEPSGFSGFVGDISRFVPVLSSVGQLFPSLMPTGKIEWPIEVPDMNGFGDIFSTVQQGLQLYQQAQAAFDYPEQEYPQPGGPDVVISPGDAGGGEVIRTAGPGGVVVAGAVALGSFLARTLGGSLGARILTGVNAAGQAMKVKVRDLWPLVRRYGPEVVAAGMGWGAAELANHLLAASRVPGGGRRGRGRGVSAAQLRNAKRTLKTIRKMYFMLPTRRSSPMRTYYHRHRR